MIEKQLDNTSGLPRVDPGLPRLRPDRPVLDRGRRDLRARVVRARRQRAHHRHAQPRQVQQELQQAPGQNNLLQFSQAHSFFADISRFC